MFKVEPIISLVELQDSEGDCWWGLQVDRTVIVFKTEGDARAYLDNVLENIRENSQTAKH